MFVVSEAEAAAIRAAFEQSGELAAAVDSPAVSGITDTMQARECARTIAGGSRYRRIRPGCLGAGSPEQAERSPQPRLGNGRGT